MRAKAGNTTELQDTLSEPWDDPALWQDPALFAGRPLPTLAAVPKKAALFALETETFLGREVPSLQGSRVLLAVSGGADSVALTLVFALLAPRLALDPAVMVCDHGLRPEAAREVSYVRRLSAWLNIPCRTAPLPVREEAAESGRGLEETGRLLRYRALEEERYRLGASFILTGHHARDLQEDMLMRMIRGTGWPALGGMKLLDAERHLLRPFLAIAPKRLRAFLKSLSIPHCEDRSNADTRFFRNRVRSELLPLLERENPQAGRALLALSREARLDESFFAGEMDRALAAHPWKLGLDAAGSVKSIVLPRALLASLHPALRLRLYHRAVALVGRDGGGQARSGTLFALEEALQENVGGKTFECPGGIRLFLKRGEVRVERAWNSPAGIGRKGDAGMGRNGNAVMDRTSVAETREARHGQHNDF